MRFWSLNTRFSVSRQVSGFHPYIGFLTALIASALLVTPLSSRSSYLRQPILWLSHRPLLLRQSHSPKHPVDTCSTLVESLGSFLVAIRVSLFAGLLLECIPDQE